MARRIKDKDLLTKIEREPDIRPPRDDLRKRYLKVREPKRKLDKDRKKELDTDVYEDSDVKSSRIVVIAKRVLK